MGRARIRWLDRYYLAILLFFKVLLHNRDFYFLTLLPCPFFTNGAAATIGITEYAAKALGDVVFVELPTVDTEVGMGDTIGAVESVKSASDIMSPVTGKILEANGALEEKPKLINEGPEAHGWVAKIRIADHTELEQLMDEASYKASLEEE